MSITIRVSENVWKQLNDMRENTKETFNDVLKKILTSAENSKHHRFFLPSQNEVDSKGGVSKSKENKNE